MLDSEQVPEPHQQRELAGETRVLSLAELAAIWRAAEADLSPVASALARLLILVRLTWHEIEHPGEGSLVLPIPASRMKGKRSHLVPLPSAAVRLQRSLPRTEPFVFSLKGGAQPFRSRKHATKRLQAAALSTSWVIHDLRRGVATQMGELGVREVVMGRVLAHSPRGFLGVTAEYEKSELLDELKHALEQWSRALGLAVSGADADVVPMRRRVTEG